MDKIDYGDASLYLLTDGRPVTSLAAFPSPLEEYRAAFIEREQPFLEYYGFQGQEIEKKSFTRGQFWDLACAAADCLEEKGLSRGDRVVHCFSANNLYDLVFRLAAVLTGCVPVTVNWQADSDETIVYKAKVTDARLILYDEDFADRLEKMKPQLMPVTFLEAGRVAECPGSCRAESPPSDYEDERFIIFTSGTTGRPKGVSLSHRSYLATRLTFEQYFGLAEDTPLDLLLANPLHHTNSSALADWGMRRPGATIHLLSRYATAYWKLLVEVAGREGHRLVAPMVSRHIDFLESLATGAKLPVAEASLKEALRRTHILIGSAPVGPTTVKRILNFSARPPHVRFGSTETCLQVMATPSTLPVDALTEAFEAGWSHCHQGEKTAGYYIGREHFPFTRLRVVVSVDPQSRGYLRPCEVGEPGYLITQGPNVMSGYVGNPQATEAVFREGWYTGLGDIVFTLKNRHDGQLDYYWMSRESALLIRGGANYAYDQLATELSRFVTEQFQLKPEQFQLAVVGLRLESEHEDSCCVTIELDDKAAGAEAELKADFIRKAAGMASKGAHPDYLRFGQIPRSFKGEILYPQLKREFLHSLENGE
ncbi:AMP-binding protein [Chloroflexota bacterium]